MTAPASRIAIIDTEAVRAASPGTIDDVDATLAAVRHAKEAMLEPRLTVSVAQRAIDILELHNPPGSDHIAQAHPGIRLFGITVV